MVNIHDIKATREQVLGSFYDFCAIALEMPLHEKPHREMCDFISDPTQKNKLMLVPRDSWKTSICSTAFPLWCLIRAHLLDGNPRFRCLIDSETVRLSQAILANIVAYVKNTPTFTQLFGSLYTKAGVGEQSVTLKFGLEQGGGLKEPHFLASGINSAKTGFHFDLITLDDLVTERNYTTEANRAKTFLHYRLMHAILESDGERKGNEQNTLMNVIGTRYHDDDLYGRIMKQEANAAAEGEAPAFATMIRAAVDDEGNLFFPSRLTLAVLAKKKRAMMGQFWAQYMNDPNKEGAPFKLEQLHFIPLAQFPERLNLIRMTVDPAIKEAQIQHGDFNAITVLGWNRFGQPYVLDASLRRDLTISAFVDIFFTMCMKYSPESIIIEETTGSLLREILQAEMIRRQMFFPVFWIKAPAQQGKQTRWLKVQSVANRGGLHIAEEIDEATKTEIRDQWCRAPFATYDDFMDSIEMHFQFMPAAPEGDAVQGTSRSMDDMKRRMLEYDASTRVLGEVFPHIRALQLAAEKEAQNPDENYFPSQPDSEDQMMLRALTEGLTWQ